MWEGGDGGMGIEYAVIEGPRSEGGSVWVCGTDAVGGGEVRMWGWDWDLLALVNMGEEE